MHNHYRLSYFSKRATCPAPELDRILSSSKRNNTQNKLTGILLYDDKSFLQLLEGDHNDVAKCFLRLAADPRHKEIDVIFAMPTQIRLFAGWELCALDVSDKRLDLLKIWSRLKRQDKTHQHGAIERLFLEAKPK
ncbi:MAG: hypothetical protein ACJA1F_000198 [Paracoccaceae bacterium]